MVVIIKRIGDSTQNRYFLTRIFDFYQKFFVASEITKLNEWISG